MSPTATSGSEDDVRNRGQQPMLASQRAEAAATSTSNGAKAGRFAGYFPLGYKDAFNQWWATVSPAIAEHNVMAFVPYLRSPPTHTQTGTATTTSAEAPMTYNPDPAREATPVRTTSITDPHGPRSWRSMMVQLSGKNRALNEFSVEREGEEVEENLVMLHGYGAGLGFFYKNFEGISRVKGLKLYALDMLGMGRSTRPPFKVHAKDPAGKISEAENWFIDALEEWRILRKIDKFTLLGHSMGGYMAVAYALKYPGHLNKLILASPVGIPEDPYAVNSEMPEPQQSTMEEEVFQDQENDIVNPQLAKGDNNNFLNGRSKAAKASSTTSPNAPPPRRIPKWVSYLWDANVSPFSIVRWSGPLGPRFTSGWTSRRFSHLPEGERHALHEYAYSLFRQRGSGEYALAYILAPGAFARSPLIRRIAGVGRQPLSNAAEGVKKETGIPVVMMYGEHDWMDIAGGFAAEERLKQAQAAELRTATPEQREAENGSAKVVVIRRAGHHLYLDGWEEFNDVMRKEMAETIEWRRRTARTTSENQKM